MPHTHILEALQTFANAHKLPEPAIQHQPDGLHAFLYSHDQTRRYAYTLTWQANRPHLLWVMLNPGTGETEGRRRNTFERCKRWSRDLGYGGLMFGNVFSLRTKSARDLLKMPQPVDELNSEALVLLSSLAPATIVAWGNHGARSDRPAALLDKLRQPRCFGLTLAGQPRHPLYVAKDTPLEAWRGGLPRVSTT
jgi:hypothetical protein